MTTILNGSNGYHWLSFGTNLPTTLPWVFSFPSSVWYDLVFAVAPAISMEGDKSVAELFQEWLAYSVILKTRLSPARNRMKLQADKYSLDREFQVGVVCF